MQEAIDYNRIATAIAYLQQNFKNQPHLDEIAEKVNLSPFHFQRMFTEWAGVSPKKFLQYISLEHAKQILKSQHTSILDTSMATGFSSPSRLHDLFIRIEGMSPGEFKNGGQQLQINYSSKTSPFGNLIIASTPKGICYMAFMEDEAKAFKDLQANFPNAHFSKQTDDLQEKALSFFNRDWSKTDKIKLHIKGTDFQLKVWEALLKIPMGRLSTYGRIAEGIEKPKAARAVGTAIGSNPVAFLIPCHRVIKSSGTIGGYMWGGTRKSAIIGWEVAKQDVEKSTI